MREWSDEQTGRRVRQLTDLPEGARVDYFRMPRHLPGGLLLAWGRHAQGNLVALDPEAGECTPLPYRIPRALKLRETDGRLWYLPERGREVWAVDLPGGTPEQVAEVPEEAPGQIADISCDGRTVILSDNVQDLTTHPIPATKDLDAFWHYFARPRNGRVWAYDIATGGLTKLAECDDLCLIHIDASPSRPELVKFCRDMLDYLGQRIWMARTDGTDLRMIRPQALHEFVTHEFWWPDGEQIGYTYQDRRGDPTIHELPWGEYSPAPTQLGIAGLDGAERYLSDPLNCYHSHLFVSPDGRWVCGEGTDGHSFVYAAPFSWGSTRVEMEPLATIHTPYVPFRGQGVESGFTTDSRWLVYNDTVEGKTQVCAVAL